MPPTNAPSSSRGSTCAAPPRRPRTRGRRSRPDPHHPLRRATVIIQPVQHAQPAQHALSARPAALLAMSGGLDAELFAPDQRRRLDELVSLLAEEVVSDLSAVPAAVAAQVEILV